MLPRALSRGLAARAAIIAAVRQQTSAAAKLPACSLQTLCTGSGSSQPRGFGSSAAAADLKASGASDADKEYFKKLGLPDEVAELLARKGTYDNFPLEAEAVTAVESLPAGHREDIAAVLSSIENAVLQKAGELQRRRRREDDEDAATDAKGGDSADRSGGSEGDKAAGGAADAAGGGASKDVPRVAALMALGLPADIAEILANEDIEYALLAERIVAIENALLLAASDKLRAERDAEAARKDANSARRDAAAGQQEQERQAGLIDELKDNLSKMEQRLKDALGHLVNRATLDREEDRMRYSRGNERQGREDAQRERFERWGRWVEEHPDEAATLAESTGWRPQDIPRKVVALYEALRDYDNIDELAKGDPDRPEVDAADVKRVMLLRQAARRRRTAQLTEVMMWMEQMIMMRKLMPLGQLPAGVWIEDPAAEGGGKDAEPKYPISDMKHG